MARAQGAEAVGAAPSPALSWLGTPREWRTVLLLGLPIRRRDDSLGRIRCRFADLERIVRLLLYYDRRFLDRSFSFHRISFLVYLVYLWHGYAWGAPTFAGTVYLTRNGPVIPRMSDLQIVLEPEQVLDNRPWHPPRMPAAVKKLCRDVYNAYGFLSDGRLMRTVMEDPFHQHILAVHRGWYRIDDRLFAAERLLGYEGAGNAGNALAPSQKPHAVCRCRTD